MNKNKRCFWLNVIMLCVFLFTIVSGFLLWLVIPNRFLIDFAGVDRGVWLLVHVGSGFLGLLGVIVHIVWHWDWLKTLRGRSLRTLKKPVRANRVIDRLIWFTFITSNTFGILDWMQPAGMPAEAIKIFSRFHVATSMAWLVFLVAHLVLHQKWIVSAVQRYIVFGLSTNDKSGLASKS